MICFHKWTWKDVLCFDFGYSTYLLQGRKCSKCGKTEFVVRGYSGVTGIKNLTEGKLKEAGLWSQGCNEK
jgi:hypothetical protein